MTKVLAVIAATVAAVTTVQDAKDTRGLIDVRSASATRTANGSLKHVVTFFGPVPANGQTGNEFLELWRSRPHALRGVPGAFQEPPYKIMGPQTGARPVFTGGEDGTPVHKTGTATVTRRGATLTFVFSRRAIGNPTGFYYWHLKTDYYGPNSVCPRGPCTDHVPNRSVVVKQPL